MAYFGQKAPKTPPNRSIQKQIPKIDFSKLAEIIVVLQSSFPLCFTIFSWSFLRKVLIFHLRSGCTLVWNVRPVLQMSSTNLGIYCKIEKISPLCPSDAFVFPKWILYFPYSSYNIFPCDVQFWSRHRVSHGIENKVNIKKFVMLPDI